MIRGIPYSMRLLISVRLGIIVLILTLIACSIGQQAGGAGAGNPATLAVIANGMDTTSTGRASLYPADCTPEFNTVKNGISHPIDTIDVILPIEDSSSTRIDVNGVYIASQCASFPIPAGVKIPDDIKEPLYCDSNLLVLDGPFIFDVLRGTSLPDIDFHLPNGVYEYINLCVAPYDDTAGSVVDSILKGYEIIITGTFTYEDTLRKIGIYILCDERWTFPAFDGGIELSDEGFVELLIGLDEQAWLDSLCINGCIKKGDIFFDDEGNLIILDDPSGQGPDARLCKKIRNNIARSGVLKCRK